MAELGGIGVRTKISRSAIRVPSHRTPDKALLLTFPNNGRLQGVIKSGVAVYANARVFLFYQPSMELIQEVRSNSLGEFVFTGLDTTILDYAVFFKHPAITTNSVVLANLTPVV